MDDRHLTTHKPFTILLAPVILLVLLVASCNTDNARLGGAPAAPAEARELTEAEMPFDPDAITAGFKASLDADTVRIHVYSLPAGTTFSQLDAYYEQLLPGSWAEQSPSALETTRASDRSAVVWTSDATREILSLQYVSAPGLDGNILVVIYAQRR